jgi:hypothetical protein
MAILGLGMVAYICSHTCVGVRGRKITGQGWPRHKQQDPIWKQTKSKRTEVWLKWLDGLTSKCEAMSFITNIPPPKEMITLCEGHLNIFFETQKNV